MTINGVEFDIDFTDADLIERADIKQQELEKQIEELEKNKDNLSPAEGIRQECKIMKDFLDYVVGEGTSEKLFGNKNSLNQCLKAYEDLIQNIEKQHNEMEERINKYSPERLKR